MSCYTELVLKENKLVHLQHYTGINGQDNWLIYNSSRIFTVFILIIIIITTNTTINNSVILKTIYQALSYSFMYKMDLIPKIRSYV